MPEGEIAARGGYTRVRTRKLPNGKYQHLFIVREPGPQGGHVVAGEVKTKKSANYKDPSYKMRPDLPKRVKKKNPRRI